MVKTSHFIINIQSEGFILLYHSYAMLEFAYIMTVILMSRNVISLYLRFIKNTIIYKVLAVI